jgi:hypothetical protein
MSGEIRLDDIPREFRFLLSELLITAPFRGDFGEVLIKNSDLDDREVTS